MIYFIKPPYLLKRMFPQGVWSLPGENKTLYLTFDDGPIPEVTPFVLDILKQFNAKATFFCVGENVARNQSIFKRIQDEGHAVGNHTFNHLDGWKTGTSRYVRNIIDCAPLIPSNLFRPPYGKLKKKQWRMIEKSFHLIYWDVLCGDFDHSTSPEKCLKNILDNTVNGSIIVFHDSQRAKRNLEYALPRTLEYYAQQGFEFKKIELN